MTTPRDVRGFRGFPLGMDNRRRETDSMGERGEMAPVLREAVNVDISESGNIKRRRGYTQAVAGRAHSVWADDRFLYMLAVVDGWLTRYSADLNATQLVELAPHLPVSYALMNGDVYWSNGETLGKVMAGGSPQPWGLPMAGYPTVTVTAGGSLPEGRYLVAQRFLGVTGEVSGSIGEMTVDVASGQGMAVTVAAGDPSQLAAVEVFVSPANGDVLYKAATAPLGATVSIGASQIGVGAMLDTRHMRSPFPGQIVRAYRGRIYVASGSVLWATEPLRFGLVKPSEALIVFPSEITMLQPVADGLYVACDAEGTSFLAGADIMALEKRHIDGSGAVRGTGVAVPGDRFNAQVLDDVALWWSNDGVLCLGGASGQVQRLTADRLSVPRYAVGTTGLFEHDGFSQILSVLRDEGTSNNLAAGDSVIAEVRKNGVAKQ